MERMKIRVSNIVFSGGELTADVEIVGSGPALPTPGPLQELPRGYDTDENVARQMFVGAMNNQRLDPVAMQRHGQLIVDALKADYPTLQVYVNPRTDALMWPGFGSVDVTIDSGRGGWYFRPDHDSPWIKPGP